MKNIHVLPTDKPSRLFIIEGKIFKYHKPQQGDDMKIINVNIYITSDEEIKEGDWCLDEDALKKCTAHAGAMNHYFKKIILTTDQDLIQDGVQAIDDEFLDGVQAIDDEFLEWFVQNPSCEEVEVYKDKRLELEQDFHFYEIIIPKEEPTFENSINNTMNIMSIANSMFGKKEEPKQETLTNDTDSHSWGFENFEVIKTEEDGKIFVETMENIPEPNDKLKKAFRDFNKQETLEEAFYKTYFGNKISFNSDIGKAFELGAKWQQEQDKNKYSEEEVIKLLHKRDEHMNTYDKLHGGFQTPKEWFKQFKKK